MSRKIVGNTKTMGGAKLRYLTYYRIFPSDTVWVRQSPIVHGLEDELTSLGFKDIPKAFKALLKSGEYSRKDRNKVWHRFKIETTKRPDCWGIGKNYAEHHAYKEIG